MGIFARLFGSSERNDDVVGDRCNDCGMGGGTHTDWCPTAAPREGRGGSSTRPTGGDTPPESGEQSSLQA